MTELEEELIADLEEAMASLVPEDIVGDFTRVPVIDREKGEFFVRDLMAALEVRGNAPPVSTVRHQLDRKVEAEEYGRGERAPDDGGRVSLAFWKIKEVDTE